MIHCRFIVALLFFSVANRWLFAQSLDTGAVFSNTQGIKQLETTFYEVEGYAIFVQHQKAPFDDKAVSKVKKKYGFSKETIPQTDTDFPDCKVLMRTDSIGAGKTASGVYYLFPSDNKGMVVIGLLTSLTRDVQLEKTLVQSIRNHTIPESVYVPMLIDSINMAGRYIPLGPVCEWMGTRNVQCAELGQFNWSEFRSEQRAQEMIDVQYTITAQKSLGELLQQDTVSVVFEGTPTRAIKATYKIKIPQLIMGGSNILVIYYVVARVRGKYIGCVLSHYADVARSNELPALLQKVMQVK